VIRVFIRKRKDRRNLVLFYDDPRTKREVSRSAGTPDRQEAARAAQRWEDELKSFRGADGDGWEWFKKRFFDERYATLSKATRGACRTALKRYAEIMNPATVSEVTTDSLSQFAAKLTDSPATVAKHLRHLKVCLRWAAQIGMIRKAPHVELPKQGKRRFMRGRALTDAEYRKMLRAVPSPAWRRFLELLYLSGLRIEEASELSWTDPPHVVHLDAKPFPQILFYGADDGGQKSRKDEAWPIPPDLANWLRKTPAAKRVGLVAPLPIRNRSDLSKAVTRIGRKAGIITNAARGKPASAHDLRRSFGSRWAMKVPPVVLQKLMRHETIETTMKYYVNLDSSQIGSVLWQGVPSRTLPRAGSKRKPPHKSRSKT
jgi:integrase